MREHVWRVALALTLIAALAGAASADDNDHYKARRLLEMGDILPLEKILEKATKNRPGRILEVELEDEKGVYVYEIEMLDENGIVHDLRYDAKTGEFLGQEDEE